MNWSDLVAALTFQVPGFQISDFEKLVESAGDFAPYESLGLSPMVEFYLRTQPDWQKKSEWILNEFKDNKISFVTPYSPQYPLGFKMMLEPPVFVSYVGNVETLSRPGIGVVGSRELSEKGREFLDLTLTDFLKRRPVNVVSGAARGIDQAAHLCALRNKCPTIALLPSGIHSPYPKSIRQWINPIIDSDGCILSEYQPYTPMHRHFFHRRNQLIVGLSQIVFVVEAKRRSGTSMTANHALNNSREVGVAPGSALDPQYGGSLDLLYEGGVLVRDHLDLISLFDGSSYIRL